MAQRLRFSLTGPFTGNVKLFAANSVWSVFMSIPKRATQHFSFTGGQAACQHVIGKRHESSVVAVSSSSGISVKSQMRIAPTSSPIGVSMEV